MKSRSYPSAAAHDDWLDESWTVDCICGVNFDDGEEMVNCDECGVWVHTRCSLYVKTDKSFACDKCKSKNNRNVSEETEVAQLLVELPTKTLRMDNPYMPSFPGRLPFKLWTDIPMDQRVHVQGIPGGETELFGGFSSSVFTQELWKRSGYVPKAFNFRFREFSCWDEGQDIVNATAEEDNENLVDIGAGALFSLSNKDADAARVRSFSGVKRLDDKGGNHSLAPSKDLNKCEGHNTNLRCPQDDCKKGRTLLRPFVFHLGKHSKEESGTSKDCGGKEVNAVNGEGILEERAQQASTVGAVKHLVCNKDRGSNLIKAETHSVKIVESKDTSTQNPLPDGPCILENVADKSQENHSSGEHHPESSAFDDPTFISLNKESLVGEKAVHHVSPCIKSFLSDDMATLLEQHNPENDAITEEVVGVGFHKKNNIGGFSVSAETDPHKSESLAGNFKSAVTKGEGPNRRDLSVDICPSSSEPGNDIEMESVLDDVGKNFNDENCTLGNANSGCMKIVSQVSGVSVAQLTSNVKTIVRTAINLQPSGLLAQGVSTGELSVKCQSDRSDELPHNPSQPKPQVEEPECPLAASSLELEPHSNSTECPPKLSSIMAVPFAPPKLGSSSSLQTNSIARTSTSDRKLFHDQLHNSSTKQGMSSIKKEDTSMDKNGEELARKVSKERSKSSLSSVSNAPNLIKASHASDSKKPSSESKDLGVCSSSRTSLALNTQGASGSDESASAMQTQSVSYMPNRSSSSGLPQKGEKVNQTCTQKNRASQMHALAPSSSPATLSDEELALLLHQELNSSPRVPRVPRMRHAGSLPQLGSPIVTTMLTKRTSNSGGRDHGVVMRKKSREVVQDESLQETDDEVKMDMLAQSPDPTRHNTECVAGTCCKREGNSSFGKGIHSSKKGAPSISTATMKGGLTSSSEANEPNFSSMQSSIRDMSDDDTGAICCPARRTLPGLIAEIMSKGQRMTYEELCNVVLPHWPNLRKHNGERYAYSSHSQAVLDCLRNRHEWAQLVDRGPKTNAGRKRRKLDAEASGPDSEDHLCGKDTTVKEAETKRLESHQEDFPKGKRQARKRKRSALQGRGIKDVRRRRKTDLNSDGDNVEAGSFSRSSEGDMMSEDEMHGGGICLLRSEASTSSDGTGIV